VQRSCSCALRVLCYGALPSLSHVVRRAITGDVAYLAYAAWTRLHRLDFAHTSLDHLGLSPERSNLHAASGGPDLARVLKRLGVPPGSRVLDLGSGKGSACVTLAAFPFSEVVGVECSRTLVEIAQANIARLRLSNVRFVCVDAAAFTDLDRFTHVYLFNPFPPVVLRQVVKNLRDSLDRQPRTLMVIYKYPGRAEETPVDRTVFSHDCTISVPLSHPFHVFRSRRPAFASAIIRLRAGRLALVPEVTSMYSVAVQA
jgi:SAM-dependent methyltransferase